jgi:hypothetical protein
MKVNNSNESVENNRLVYTGVHKIKVLAVNPTNAELAKLGYTIKEDSKEQEYTGIKIQELDYSRVRFLVQFSGKTIINGNEVTYNDKTNLDFLISDRDVISQNGNVQHINNGGGTAYSSTKENPKMTWFWGTPNRVAKQGEADLLHFLKVHLNIAPKEECKLDTWNKIVKGDVSEIKKNIGLVPNNQCFSTLGMKEVEKDGKVTVYQTIYNKHFVRASNLQPESEFSKHFANYTGNFNYQNDFTFKPVLEKVVNTAKPDVADASDDDDMPF